MGHVRKNQHSKTRKKNRKEYESLFPAQQSTGDPNLLYHVNPIPLDDPIPSEEEISEVVRKMRVRKAPEGSDIKVEHQ
jgi:hypothetical protein